MAEVKQDTNGTIASKETKNGSASPVKEKQVNGQRMNGVLHDNAKKYILFDDQDRMADADTPIAWERDAAVKLRLGASGMEAIPSMSVMSMFKSSVKKLPHTKALAYKEDGMWKHLTYMQYYERICSTAKSFIKLGLQCTRGVGILGFNSKEWFFSNFGAIFAGGLSVGIYTTNSAEAILYVASSSECNIMVVENDAQLKKVLQIWDELPSLKAVVQYSGQPQTDRQNVYSWEAFMELGKDVADSELEKRMADQCVNKCCSLIYTSGTTGRPKGVMLSHDNITYASRVIGQNVNVSVGDHSIISYLPLSHIAAQLLDMYLPVCYASTVYFAQPDALKGSLNETMKETQPTIFFGVPRVYEKMEEKLRSVLSQSTGMKLKMANWARGVASKTAANMSQGGGRAMGHFIANQLVFKKIRAALGLSNCQHLYCGAAPLSSETHQFFASLGLPIMEVYGMSESCGAATMTVWSSSNQHWKSHSAGYRINGYGYDLLNRDERGHGEIAMVGRHVFMGYLGEEQKTRETFDEEFRLKSGDVGYTDKDGFLFISGRIKELLITAGGENVAPVPIEDAVKEELRVISNCMLIGDRQKFLSLLVTLKCDVNLETLKPTQNFTKETLEWCQSINSQAKTVPDVLDSKDEAVTKAIEAAISRANNKSESRAKKIQKFIILPEDFSIPGGELGPTLKLKRPAVLEKYGTEIAAMYSD